MKLAEGVKFDNDKNRIELLPSEAIEKIAEVFTLGAKKYEDDNWRKGISWRRVFGAMMRHMWAWARGVDKDPEWGKSHLAHAGACLFFLLWYEDHRREFDDRAVEKSSTSGLVEAGTVVMSEQEMKRFWEQLPPTYPPDIWPYK